MIVLTILFTGVVVALATPSEQTCTGAGCKVNYDKPVIVTNDKNDTTIAKIEGDT